MRNILICLFAFVALALNAQERTVNLELKVGETYKKYTGTTSDILIPTTTDTIDVVIAYQSTGYVKKIAVKTRFDKRTTADTTVSVSVFGKEFSDDDTYVQVIAAATSSAVTTDNVIQVLVSDPYETNAGYVGIIRQHNSQLNTDTLTVPSHVITEFDKSYRYYRIRYILSGDDSVGTGIKIDEIEFKIYGN